MTVTVEVPEGHKFCKKCGGVFPKDTGFYQQRKFSKATGETKLYPRQLCKKCNDAQVVAIRKVVSRSAATRRLHASLPALATEIIDAAWMETQIVFRRGGKLHWRARHRDVPPGAELIGAYDKGARYDRVLLDLSA